MSNVIAFPTPEARAHREFEDALDRRDVETILRLSVTGALPSVRARARRWLAEVLNVAVGLSDGDAEGPWLESDPAAFSTFFGRQPPADTLSL